MPSKGIRVYAYIAVPDCVVEFSTPGRTARCDEQRQFWKDELEVDKKDLDGPFSFTGKFSFKVTKADQEITTQWININALTGHTEDGTMNALKQTPSIVKDQLIVAYGFYDAGPGQAGLPSQDQCYVTVTPNNSNWMEQLVPRGSPGIEKSFAKMILPAVHDVGMNSLQNAIALLEDAGDDVIKLALEQIGVDASVHFGLADSAISHIAPNIIESLAITQKDNLDDLLAIGARYFEFRPASMLDKFKGNMRLPDVLYFQHACIPGMAAEEFLHTIANFLVAHPFEIVVVQVRYDGVLGGCAKPSDEQLDDLVNKALDGTGLQRGRLPDLQATIHELRVSGKRLIFMRPVPSFSTYTDPGNATLDGDSIVAEFEKLNVQDQEGDAAFTNIQCQATATNVKDAVIYSALAANASNSCLMATKAICDSKTLPWLRDNALGRLHPDKPAVIMNDFFDVSALNGHKQFPLHSLDYNASDSDVVTGSYSRCCD